MPTIIYFQFISSRFSGAFNIAQISEHTQLLII
nr:MAG TPA: hypothetical protein [Caudoviricetes sp.]DAW92918.1 MAG TPA: hypothetical protein [Bacteriophage sp.]